MRVYRIIDTAKMIKSWYQEAKYPGEKVAISLLLLVFAIIFFGIYGLPYIAKHKEGYEKDQPQISIIKEDLFFKGYKLQKNKNYTEAVKYMYKAAVLGSVGAQACLGWNYLNGLGVEQDYGKAIKWYGKAAEQDNLTGTDLKFSGSAQTTLAWIYATCREQKYRDGAKAVEFALKALSLESNNWNRISNLAVAYARNGQFEKAIKAGEKSIELLKMDNNISKAKKQEMLKKSYELLNLYKKKEAYVED